MSQLALRPWNPLKLGTPWAWWHADYGITLASTKVASWADRVNGRTIAQPIDGARPTFNSTGWNGNKAAVVFSNYTDLRLASVVNWQDGYTILATVYNDIASVRSYLIYLDNGASGTFAWGLHSDNKELFDIHGGGADIFGSTYTVNVNRLCFRRRVLGGVGTNESTINNAASISSNDNTTLNNDPLNNLTIGGNSTAGTAAYRGRVRELIIYPFFSPSYVSRQYFVYSKRVHGG